MEHVQAAQLAGSQFNRISRQQLGALGIGPKAVEHAVATGRMVIVQRGVLAFAPVLPHDDWGRWMGATLTAPGSVLSHASAAAAWGFWSLPRAIECITRVGGGGRRRRGSVLVFHTASLDGDRTALRGIPVTRPARTVLDLAPHVSERALARAVREAVRLRRTSIEDLVETLGRHLGRRGCGRLGAAVARYTGLPIERARSGAEVRALELLRDAGRPLPRLNVRIAGEEADLSWARERRIIEIDGGPFHLDRGDDVRKQRRWEGAGWCVDRIPDRVVYDEPRRLLLIAPQ